MIDSNLHARSESGRDGINGARAKGAIGFAALRGRSVAGNHMVILASDKEPIELTPVTVVEQQPCSGAPSSDCIQPPAPTLRQQDFISFSLLGKGAMDAGNTAIILKSRRAWLDSTYRKTGIDISILVSILVALLEILQYTTCCGLLLTLGVDMEDTNSRQMVKYSPISPAVLFHRMRTDIHGRWDQSKMVDAVRRWLRPAKKTSMASNPAEPRRTSSNIIIPDAHDPFMLLAKSDPMSNLLAENNRLRNLINELLVADRRTRSPEFRH